MLELDIQLAHGRFTLDVQACLQGPAIGVLGPSGCGKTTLLHCLAGLAAPDSGRIVMDGEVLFDRTAGVNIPVHRRGVGIVFQDARLFPHYTVRGNLQYAVKLARSAAAAPGLEYVARLLEIEHLLERSVTNLSGGERQRVAIGRAILARPRLLLLDEPLSGVDNELKQEILPFLHRIRDVMDSPMVFVSHDQADLRTMCDELLVMNAGRAVAHGGCDGVLGEADNQWKEFPWKQATKL